MTHEGGTVDWFFEPTGTHLHSEKEKQQVYITFGEPTVTEEESTSQAAFLYEHIIGEIYPQKSESLFFIIANFEKLDDSASPSTEALRLYAKIIRDPQTAMVLCYNVHEGMKGIIQILSHTPKIKKKIGIVFSHEEALKAYDLWAHGDVTMRKIDVS